MPFSETEYQLITRDYICAQCYGDLHHLPVKGQHKWQVLCRTCDTDVEDGGRVTRQWAEGEGQKRAQQYKDKRVRSERGKKSKRTPPDQIISELGY